MLLKKTPLELPPADLLQQVEKPGRYIGGEWNSKKKNPSRVKVKIALIFPDVYEIGMSYLGQKILYSVLNSRPNLLAERVFAPWPDLEARLRTQKAPLFSLENKLPLREFDILGFSLLYELNYSNILTILDLGNIPFLSAERSETFPLVLAGGPGAFNPEAVSDIFDAFLIGDGEEAFLEIIEKFTLLREMKVRKTEILKELARIEGVYVPNLYETFEPAASSLLARRTLGPSPPKIKKRVFVDHEGATFPEKIIVPTIRVIHDRVALEVARGCPQRCRFCQATNIYFPFRAMNPGAVIRKACRSLHSTGYEEVSLSTLSISDYPYLEETVSLLMTELAERKISLSLSSLRPKGLSSEVARNILMVRKTGFTLVPEGGTERLRRVINKRLTNQEILTAAAAAFEQGWRLLKLYFMVGLPTEREEDIEGIAALVEEIVTLGRKIRGSIPRINCSLSSFIPKPHTPFQWLPMEDEKVLREKHLFLKSRLKKFPSIRIKEHPAQSSILEAIFSRGDRRLGAVLRRAWKKGARFDSWKDFFRFSLYEEAFEAEKLDFHVYLGSLAKEAVLPWDHIDTGISKSYLLGELERAFREEETPSCLERECNSCQGCIPELRTQKKHPPPDGVKARKLGSFGEKGKKVFRYELTYSKRGPARFISHLDLLNHLQRAFRRAGIEVAHSRGFHPKMLLSSPPALPLGMEGKEEILEFKSSHLFEEKKLLSRLNRNLGAGLKAMSLRLLDDTVSSLSSRIQGMVYSLDLRNKDVREAIKTRMKTEELPRPEKMTTVERWMADFMLQNSKSVQSYSLDKKKRKLSFELPFSPQGGLRPQTLVREVFGLERAAFSLTRERIVCRDRSASQEKTEVLGG